MSETAHKCIKLVFFFDSSQGLAKTSTQNFLHSSFTIENVFEKIPFLYIIFRNGILHLHNVKIFL